MFLCTTLYIIQTTYMWEKHFICTLKLDFLVLLSSRLSQTFVLEPLQVEGSYIFPLGKAYSTCRAYQISSCRCRRHTELLWSLLSHAGTQLPPAADVRHHELGVVSTEIFLWQIFPTVFFFSWFASSPCHFPILWCFSSTKHEWPDPSSRANP